MKHSSPTTLSPDLSGDTQQLSPVPVHESVLFLARFLGTAVQLERLRDTLAGQDSSRHGEIDPDLLRRLLANAGLVASPLSANRQRKPTEMPALVVGEGGQTVAVVNLKDGRLFECQLPGIAGTTWLDAAALAAEVPGGRWYAVRPRLFFDQRSLLYALPEPARWFWGVFRRNQWIYHWALAGTVALNIFGALVPFYSMAVYDRVIPNNALGSLAVLTTGVMLLIVFEFVMRLMRSHLLETAARRIDVALSARVFAQCLKLRAANRPASGGVLANTVRDFEAVRDFFATTTLTVLGDLPFLLLYIAIIFMVGGPLGWVPVACIPLLLAISLLSRGALSRKVNESMRESSQRTAHLFETMNGLDTVKAIGAEAWSRRKWEGLTQAIAENNLETREIMARINYGNAAVMALSTVAVVAAGSVMVAEQAITLGQIIGVSLLAGRALAPVAQIASLIVRWEQTKMSYEALDKIMNAPTDEAPNALQAPPLTGQLEFRDVSFAYPNQPPVVERISLRVRPGERVGIIGKLGSGKSTLLKLILNQYEPSTGSVLVDNLVTTQLEPLSLRRQIGYVPQDVTLFHGTLRENIELGRVRTDDARLLEAARIACLDEIVAQLPEGVGTQVGERGERLSGGQRQSVAIARALLNKPRLLLLDEPSSMVDPASEQRLIERMRGLQNTTIVLVTHRMAMLALVDRLVVMDRGRIVADGPRDQVLQALSAQRQSEDAAAAARAATARAAADAASSAVKGQADSTPLGHAASPRVPPAAGSGFSSAAGSAAASAAAAPRGDRIRRDGTTVSGDL
ncbi:type I secretion system permease/ATPase [Aquabacterium sp. OR-4]|uniref:type I secretion system permease/ATPase n=1 Tax=Aquabacterium sp. OR-4 TaxID=2978127 RepID=UPI0028CB04C5|nr:type I secretion system permease/ATPase [Aquabacterium sp. OR-4]MDT7837382.1 type I secretion system permease/ATPase [Aquabacterium sp. OR-4]